MVHYRTRRRKSRAIDGKKTGEEGGSQEEKPQSEGIVAIASSKQDLASRDVVPPSAEKRRDHGREDRMRQTTLQLQTISPDIKKARGAESMEVDKEGSQNTSESDSTINKILMSDVEPSKEPQISYDMSPAQIEEAFDDANSIWEFDKSAKPPTYLWGQGPKGFAVTGELTGYQAMEEVYGVWTGSVAFTVNKIVEGMRKEKSNKKIQITRANWRRLFLTWMDFENNDKNIPAECFHYLSTGI